MTRPRSVGFPPDATRPKARDQLPFEKGVGHAVWLPCALVTHAVAPALPAPPPGLPFRSVRSAEFLRWEASAPWALTSVSMPPKSQGSLIFKKIKLTELNDSWGQKYVTSMRFFLFVE